MLCSHPAQLAAASVWKRLLIPWKHTLQRSVPHRRAEILLQTCVNRAAGTGRWRHFRRSTPAQHTAPQGIDTNLYSGGTCCRVKVLETLQKELAKRDKALKAAEKALAAKEGRAAKAEERLKRREEGITEREVCFPALSGQVRFSSPPKCVAARWTAAACWMTDSSSTCAKLAPKPPWRPHHNKRTAKPEASFSCYELLLSSHHSD